jgi:hypothetical protein
MNTGIRHLTPHCFRPVFSYNFFKHSLSGGAVRRDFGYRSVAPKASDVPAPIDAT